MSILTWTEADLRLPEPLPDLLLPMHQPPSPAPQHRVPDLAVNVDPHAVDESGGLLAPGRYSDRSGTTAILPEYRRELPGRLELGAGFNIRVNDQDHLKGAVGEERLSLRDLL